MKPHSMTSPPIEFAFKFCPRCAAPNPDVGAIPLKCQACRFTLYFGPVAAVGGLILNDRDEMLLVRRARNPGLGMFGLPGGFIDREETAEQALRREVFEETGLAIFDLRMLMTHPNGYQYGGITVPVLDLFFECRVVDPSQLKLADDELSSSLWTRPNDEQLSQMAFPSNRLAIEYWLAETETKSRDES